MHLSVAEILTKISKLKKTDAIVETLRQNQCPALLTVLQGSFDERIKFLLPPGVPPYTPTLAPETHNVFHREYKKMYLFIEGGNPGLAQAKREYLFIQLLEAVHPDDAKVVLNMKDKKPLTKNLTKDIINTAFPGIIP